MGPQGSLFPPGSTDGDPLAVGGPDDVFDCPTDGLVLILQDVLFLCRVPNANLPRGIYRGEKGLCEGLETNCKSNWELRYNI